jgi:hypothetical protein
MARSLSDRSYLGFQRGYKYGGADLDFDDWVAAKPPASAPRNAPGKKGLQRSVLQCPAHRAKSISQRQ